MKYLIILGDGMADEPLQSLGGKTCLQAANKPFIDKITTLGRSGMLQTVPAGFTPGSEIANLSVLGYNVADVFEGRGSLEAASMGVEIEENEMAMRCNLICIENGKIKNHSAGHISNDEANELIDFLQQMLGNDQINFFSGVSYRHLFKLKGGNKNLICTPPHDVPGTPFADVMIKANDNAAQTTANLLNSLTLRSQQLLENHPVNLKRAAQGKDKANSIWLWSPGYKPKMNTLHQIYGIADGSVISAVDLIRGIGVYAGLKPIYVQGATGLYDTNYEGKAQAAIEALKTDDFVYLHIEASDEAGHEGDAALKIRTIENLDQRIVKPIFNEISTWEQDVTIAILPDHPTPCAIRTHSSDPVPFVIYRRGETPDKVQSFDEFSCKSGYYKNLKGDEFMKELIRS
ncbi:MAG: cofactor-independent phosphoglycerate mutase [Paludibacter sp.]|jgi:2,3-bisphosphoglycerate-independent phosphoglycerate mutase|nr:cofactor-independent phosphoglycerate mutase [Paludibacter sp.]